jgi:hypothetical protein
VVAGTDASTAGTVGSGSRSVGADVVSGVDGATVSGVVVGGGATVVGASDVGGVVGVGSGALVGAGSFSGGLTVSSVGPTGSVAAEATAGLAATPMATVRIAGR